MSITWKCHTFETLSTALLYDILQARQEVFILEQKCFYLDADDLDKEAIHICGFDGSKLIAYGRVLPPGLVYPEASFGRVLVKPDYRGKGIGKELTRLLIQKAQEQYNRNSLCISAQAYLEEFYHKFGFESKGSPYLDAGIPHIKMIRSSS